MNYGIGIIRAMASEIYEHIDKDEVAVLADNVGAVYLIYNDEDKDCTCQSRGHLNGDHIDWSPAEPLDYHDLVNLIQCVMECSAMVFQEYEKESENLNKTLRFLIGKWMDAESGAELDKLTRELGATKDSLEEALEESVRLEKMVNDLREQAVIADRERTTALIKLRHFVSKMESMAEEADEFLMGTDSPEPGIPEERKEDVPKEEREQEDVNMEESVRTVCTGDVQVWKTRREAMDFFMEGICACDPQSSEAGRYTAIYADLAAGCPVGWDGMKMGRKGSKAIKERNEWMEAHAEEVE